MFGAVGIIVIVLVSVVLARLKPAAPTVERATVWVDTVKRGPMVRQVRGLGTLVPVDEARRWVPASTQGRVEKIIMRPGVQVTPDTVVLELERSERAAGAERCRAAAARRRGRLQQPQGAARCRTLNQRAPAAIVGAEYQNAQTEREMNEGLSKEGLVSNLVLKQSVVRAESLATRDKIESERLKVSEASARAVAVVAGAVDQRRSN